MSSTNSIQIGQQETSFWGRLRLTLARRTEGRGVALLAVVLVVVAFTEPLVFTAYPVSLGRIALIGLGGLGPHRGHPDGRARPERGQHAGSLSACGGGHHSGRPALGVIAALAVGLGVLIGVVNAFLVAIVGINSFIATLGMLFALRGLAFVLSDEAPVRMAERQRRVLPLACRCIGPLTPRVLIFILLPSSPLQVFVSRVKAGREFFAVGAVTAKQPMTPVSPSSAAFSRAS